MQQQLHEKNPNGVYLNKGQYGEFGRCEANIQFLQNLLQLAQNSPDGIARWDISVGHEKQNQKGELYRRGTFRLMSQRPQRPQQPMQQQPMQQQFTPQQEFTPQPAPQQPVQYQAHQPDPYDDSIPF